MILLVSVCSEKFGENEFVRPVQSILANANISCSTRHYTELRDGNVHKSEKAIICGTALKDFGYLANMDRFEWLKKFEKPVLGICAGYQIILTIFSNKIVEKTRIGQFKVNILHENKLTTNKEFYSYFLNSRDSNTQKHFIVLAKTRDSVCMVKHENKEIYGCLFHPEALNQEIIANFASSRQST